MSTPGPQTAAALSVMAHKYGREGEGWREICNRVADAVSDDANHYRDFREILLNMRFLPGGRCLAALGTTKRVTAYNCFVSGTIEDKLVGSGSIFDRLQQAARTLQMGGGIGYDFSTIRPRGDTVRSVEGRASGPISFMEVYNAMGSTISSAGERRGAQMGILRVDHPDIEEFVLAKQNQDRLRRFNLSVAVTDRFMGAVQAGGSHSLEYEGRCYREVDARTLWETVMRGTWDWGEPGVVFIDRINEGNNLKYCETIAATNPCSEQPLPPFGACLLGSFNLTGYLRQLARPSRLEGRYWFDWKQFIADIPVVVRAMDNVIDVALYPLPEQEAEAKSKRRMGLGVMGLANAIEAQGCPYGTPDFVAKTEEVMEKLKNEAYFASACLADKKGCFPAYNDESYLQRPFVQGLTAAVRGRIMQSGVRNSHLTTVAPTGTIAFVADNVSSGIEPVFAAAEERTVQMPEGPVKMAVFDYGLATLGVEPRSAKEISVEEHLAVLCTVQRHVDSAVSKTCNVSSTMEWRNFKGVYQKAWEGGAKGCATYQVEGKRDGVRQAATMGCVNGACSG